MTVGELKALTSCLQGFVAELEGHEDDELVTDKMIELLQQITAIGSRAGQFLCAGMC